MNSTKIEIETVPANAAERVHAIRFRLPGQAVMERIELARVAYGPLYTIGLVQERVAETLPTRIGYVRSTAMEPIEEYRGPMPDEVLLKYDDAARSGRRVVSASGTPLTRRGDRVERQAGGRATRSAM